MAGRTGSGNRPAKHIDLKDKSEAKNFFRANQTYSAAGAVGVDVSEATAVKALLHILLSAVRVVPAHLQQVVLQQKKPELVIFYARSSSSCFEVRTHLLTR